MMSNKKMQNEYILNIYILSVLYFFILYIYKNNISLLYIYPIYPLILIYY